MVMQHYKTRLHALSPLPFGPLFSDTRRTERDFPVALEIDIVTDVSITHATLWPKCLSTRYGVGSQSHMLQILSQLLSERICILHSTLIRYNLGALFGFDWGSQASRTRYRSQRNHFERALSSMGFEDHVYCQTQIPHPYFRLRRRY